MLQRISLYTYFYPWVDYSVGYTPRCVIVDQRINTFYVLLEIASLPYKNVVPLCNLLVRILN